MRILIISDAWHPQVNGVVRTLTMLQRELGALGHDVEGIGPDRFRTIGMPSYRSIQFAVAPSARLVPTIEAFRPEHVLQGARPGVGALDSDLRAAALRALHGDRCRLPRPRRALLTAQLRGDVRRQPGHARVLPVRPCTADSGER